MQKLTFVAFCFFLTTSLTAQINAIPLNPNNIKRCFTEEAVRQAIKKNPAIIEQWRKKGIIQYQAYLQRRSAERGGLQDTMIIPVVFHIVDDVDNQNWITDRNLYDQIEILNEAYGGKKVEKYKDVIPDEIYQRRGSVPLKFVLARRTPGGSLTNGIERRSGTTPDRIGIKYTAQGGLDAWDTDKYLNVWVGSFTGDDDGLLGIATFPFLDTEGPQGVVIHSASLPFTSNVSRVYYPIYSEGATLVHEVGHFFYLMHTFGDLDYCNNADFRIQPGWPLPAGAGPEGDDTPEEKQDDKTTFGDPSMNFSDGCTSLSFGEMYGSFMNYFDDRALFMFSNGQSKRITGCIDLYRSQLANSIGAVPPVATNDAYMVSVSPHGNPERAVAVLPNVPLTATIRNYGSSNLNNVTVSVLIDGSLKFQQTFAINIGPLTDTTLRLGNISAADGLRTVTIYTSNPNGAQDQFTDNDTLQSFVIVTSPQFNAPYSQDFSGAAFPPAGWKIWNPNGDSTWTLSPTSGSAAAGSATAQFRKFPGVGGLDDLIMPAIKLEITDSAQLSFKHAYATSNGGTVTTWDALEVYVSNDSGRTYHLAYKKSGTYLRTTPGDQTSAFVALPTDNDKWASDLVNITPYLNGVPLLIKFRAVNAKGNNLYLDDIKVNVVKALNRDAHLLSINALPQYICDGMPSPEITFSNDGKDVLKNLDISYTVNNGPVVKNSWSGNLNSNTQTAFNIGQLPTQLPGSYQLTVFTSKPNGLEDESPMNDTLRTMFYVMGRSGSPVTEDFEKSTFPSDQWVLQQNGNGHSWEKTSNAASSGSSSMVIRNFNYNMQGKADNLISPIIFGNSDYDSLFLSLNYAYAPGADYPIPTGQGIDTLEIKISMDCGQTFTTVFKKYGGDLITVSDPNARKNTAFIAGKDDWDSLRIYLTPTINKSDFQVFITSKGNNGNNLYVDNIQVFGVIVPALLKERGYLLYPSPFKDQFIVRNFEQPVGLQAIHIYNSTGQLVWQQQYNGNADKMIFINAANWSRGIYTVKLQFKDRSLVDRVVKQ